MCSRDIFEHTYSQSFKKIQGKNQQTEAVTGVVL